LARVKLEYWKTGKAECRQGHGETEKGRIQKSLVGTQKNWPVVSSSWREGVAKKSGMPIMGPTTNFRL